MPKKKEAPFKLNKDGYYRTTFTVVDAQGNKKRIPLRDKDPYELERKLQQKKFEYERGLLVVNGNSTVEKWALEWLDTYKKPRVLTKCYNKHKSAINKYIIPEIGHMKLSDVKVIHIERLLNDLTHLSSDYIGFIYNALNSMFSKAVSNDLLVKNPCAYAEKPKGKQQTELRSLTSKEESIFLEIAKKHHRGVMFKISLKCGLRPGEVRALDRNDIDLKKHQIRIKNAVESGKTNIKETKTEKGVRIVPIPSDFEKELIEILPDSGLVFPSNSTGKVMTEQNYYRSWSSFKRLMNIEAGAKVYRNKILEPVIDDKITPYYLRHTYCTHLAEKGIDIRTAQYLMGHANIDITAKIYTHVENSTVLISDAAKKLEPKAKRKFRLKRQ